MQSSVRQTYHVVPHSLVVRVRFHFTATGCYGEVYALIGITRDTWDDEKIKLVVVYKRQRGGRFRVSSANIQRDDTSTRQARRRVKSCSCPPRPLRVFTFQFECVIARFFLLCMPPFVPSEIRVCARTPQALGQAWHQPYCFFSRPFAAFGVRHLLNATTCPKVGTNFNSPFCAVLFSTRRH